ncbi:MAG: CotH kinase family protein [Dysgonamonadaceae bacterium]|jgi:hypothetical protein|nr:CotH kinase family protein [Dysgonamonadaceae bacterium]
MNNRLILSLFFFSLFSVCFADNEDLLFSPKGVAIVKITLPNGMGASDIQKDVDTKAFMEIENSDNSSYDLSELYSGDILIEGRGNSTWDFPKKPYNIDLITDSEEDNPSPLLGMPAHHKWCLIAYYADKSLMRIPLAYYLGSQLSGLPYTARLVYVEVYINGIYRGLYSLCEKIARDKNRVDIKKLDAESENLSGGYILEIIPNVRLQSGDKRFTMKKSSYTSMIFTYPKNKNVTDEQIAWIKSYINEFEDVLYGTNFKDPVNGFRKYIDENSFIDWFILNELSQNCDAAMYASVFLHKDRDGKLFMSSPWDFDIAFGNYESECRYDYGFRIRNAYWWSRLFADEQFAKKMQERYDELMPLLNKIPIILKTNAEFLEQTGCVDRNFAQWPILGQYVWPNVFPYPTSFRGEVQRFVEWTASRQSWLYINFPADDSERERRFKSTRPIIRVMEPEIFMQGLGVEVKALKTYTHIWIYNNVEENINNNESYAIKKKGKYYLQFRDNKGNKSLYSYPVSLGEKSNYDYLNITTPAVSSLSIQIYPNPVRDWLFIHYPSSKSEIHIRLMDLNGRVIKQSVSSDESLEWDLSSTANGVYILQVQSNSEICNQKIIISH